MKKLAVFALAALLVSVSCTLEETIDEITSLGNTYTVSFVLHGGTIAGSTEYGPVKVQHSHTIPKPPDPQKDGYIFSGWTASGSGNIGWDFSNGVTRNMTLEAMWRKKLTVTSEKLYLWYDKEISGFIIETYEGKAEKLSIPSTYTSDSGQHGAIKGIAAEAFSNAGLSEITLPETIESIGDRAFAGCTMLKEIRIPSSVSRMGEKVFSGIIIDVYLPWPETSIPAGWSDSWKDGATIITIKENH